MRKGTLLLAVLAFACVSVRKTVLDTSFQANPIAEEDVFVYVAGDSIPEHTRVATLDARSRSREGFQYTDYTDLRNAMRKEAGKLGANAIIWEGDTRGFLSAFTSSRVSSSAVAIYVPSLGRGGNDNR